VLNLSLTILQFVPPLCDYKVWIDTERDADVKCYHRSMVELNMMMSSVLVGWRSVGMPLSLPDSVRWIVMSIKRNESRRGHTNVRKYDVRRKRMSEVVMKRSGRPNGQVLLKIDGLVRF
jgi:hypothetical protein